MSHSVFVSYSRQDQAAVDRLTADLQKHGISVWIDHASLQPGTPNWEASLRQAIKEADWVLLAASPSAQASAYVPDELALARLLDVPIIPVWVAGDAWIESVSLGMGRVQYIDLRGTHYPAGLHEVITILQHEQPEDLIQMETDLLPLPVRYALLYGLPGGLLAGLALQYPLHDWLRHWLLDRTQWDSMAVVLMLLAPLPLLLFGLALTQLFVRPHHALPSMPLRTLCGALMGGVYGLMAYQMVIGGYMGLIANREMLHIFNWNMETQDSAWLRVIADATLQTSVETISAALLMMLILVGMGAVMSQWLMPVSPSSYVPSRTRELFWPLMIVFGLYILEFTLIFATVIFASVDSSLDTTFAQLGEQRPINVLPFLIMPTWTIKLLLQSAALWWLWKVPLSAVHRTGLRTAQITYGLGLGTLSVVPWLLFLRENHDTPPLVFVVLSLGLALAFAWLAQRKLREAQAVQLAARLTMVWWQALISAGVLYLVIQLVAHLLLVSVMYSLVLITVTMIPAQAAADAPWDNIFYSVLHWLPLMNLQLTGVPLVIGSLLLMAYLLWATRRERRLSLPFPLTPAAEDTEA